MGASRIFAIDKIPFRLKLAKSQGLAECINYNEENPLEIIKELTKNSLADIVIDAVGVNAEQPSSTPKQLEKEFEKELDKIAPKTNPDGHLWQPGTVPARHYAMR